MFLKRLASVVLFVLPMLSHIPELYKSEITKVCGRYYRQYTILEIGNRTDCYVTELAPAWSVGALIYLGDHQDKIIKQVMNTPIPLSVMAPPQLTITMLETLAQCEHFDVVIVHDISSFIDVPLPRLVAALTKLGERLFLEVQSREFEAVVAKSSRMQKVVSPLNNYPALYCYTMKKNHLDRARYTQPYSYAEKPRYFVTSTPFIKEFYKEGLEYPLPWIHGINLVTFVMLYGIYPTDAQLRKQFLAFRQSHEEHNDLVIGNMILKGAKLYPIDLADARRNAHFYRCITTALRYFRKGNTRLLDPQVWIDGYYNDIV